MSTLGVVFLALVGLLGVYLFITVHSEHQGESKERELQHQIQIERFDRDFEKAWNKEKLPDPERAQRLLDLEKQQSEAKTRAAAQGEDSRQRERELRRALDQLSGYQDKKGQP